MLDTIMLFLDSSIIIFYRLIGDPLLDYLVGTFLLALLTAVIGEFTISIAFRFNKKYIDATNNDLIKTNNLSIEALQYGDKEAYKACNKLANDAFGKVFFNMIALSAASLWPVFFALAWMQSRFSGIEFPLPVHVPGFGTTVGYFFTYFLLYVLARILFKNIKHKLPYFKKMQRILREYDKDDKRMITIADIWREKVSKK